MCAGGARMETYSRSVTLQLPAHGHGPPTDRSPIRPVVPPRRVLLRAHRGGREPRELRRGLGVTVNRPHPRRQPEADELPLQTAGW